MRRGAVRRACSDVDFLARSGSRTGVPEGVAFDVDRFEWIHDRLEVSGRWYGLRGHRFVRPALTVEIDEPGDDRRRMLADLEHKPWAAEDGTDWTAAFPWDGDPVRLARAELAVAPTVAVDLPVPHPPGRRRSARRAGKPEPAARKGSEEERRAPRRGRESIGAKRDTLARERDKAIAERDAAVARRDALASERDEAVAARDAALAQRDSLASERNALAAERDEAVAARDAALAQRDSLAAERDALAAERDPLAAKRDAAAAARAAALTERDEAIAARDAALAQRDSLAAARDEALAARSTALAERDSLARELRHARRSLAEVVAERDAARAARQHDLETIVEPEPPPQPAPRLPRAAPPSLRRQPAVVVWGQRLVAVLALGVLAFVVYTLLEGVV